MPSAVERAGRARRPTDEEMPTTAIIAAMPMAMPSADRKARIGRVRRPDGADPQHVAAGRIRPEDVGSRRVSDGRHSDRRCRSLPRSRATIRPSRIRRPARGRRRGDLPVVGDDHDGGAGACRSRSRSITPAPETESRAPVGSSASSSGGSPATARAMATRCRSPPDSSCGSWSSRWPEPDPLQRGRGPPPPLGRPQAGVQQAVGHVVQRRDARRPGGTAGRRSRSGSPAARTAGRSDSAATS